MTQEELRAALLLLDFHAGPQKTYWYFARYDIAISVTCHMLASDVTVTDHAVIRNGNKHEFRCSPQRAFDYIKEKLI